MSGNDSKPFEIEEEVEMTNMENQQNEHDSSAAPLIERDDVQTAAARPRQASGGNRFIWTLTIAACIGGLLFGYDTGVISSTLVSIGTDLSQRHLTSLDKGLITASTSLFALIASPIAGILADRHGRKSIIIGSDILFTAGALWQAITTSVWGMILGRSIVGLAIGGASLIVPLYIAELAPGHLRGRLTTVQLLLITGGQAVAYIIGWIFSSMPGGWRWMVGIGAGPALMQTFVLALMPETPRYLARAGKEEKARQILKRVYRGTVDDLDATVDATLGAIKKEIMEEEEAATSLKSSREGTSILGATLSSLLFYPPHARALTIACLLQGIQQACGFNSLMYFSATIFSQLGFTSPTLTSLSIALTNFAFTVVAFSLIDRLGRRRSLLYTIPIMIVSLLLAAAMFKFVNLRTEDVSSAPVSSDSSSPKWPTYLILVALMLYVSSYATGLGPVPWQQSELFPLSVRSLGSSLSTSTNWGLNTIVGLTFLPMMQTLTPSWTFAVYAVVCCFGWVAIWWCYPETMGMEIEDVGGLLKDGWGVKESMERLRRLKEQERRNRTGY